MVKALQHVPLLKELTLRDNAIVDSFIPLAENLIHVPDLNLYLSNTDIYECEAAYCERDSRIEIWVSTSIIDVT